MEKNREYIPALRFDWLTSFYDPLVRLTVREKLFKSELIRQAELNGKHSVLDLACGTGTLTIMIKEASPNSKVVGLDGDEKILSLARTKARKAGAEIELIQGLSYQMPFSNHQFDKVLTSLFFHHLSRENKVRTLREVLRILKPGGMLHIADWGKAQNPLMRIAYLGVQLLDGFETTTDNVRGHLPKFCLEAGFTGVTETTHYSTMFGTLSLIKAMKPK